MEIIIENFRDTKHKKIFFEKGVTLLDGPSGIGKSTVFESVKWCLYGGMKNIIPNGQKSLKTRVSIFIGNITVSRNNHPETVKFKEGDEIYEGKDAICLIEKNFGTKKLWETSSYLVQDERNFLLCTSQKEKTEIVKEILFDIDTEESDTYKEKISKYIGEKKQENQKLAGEIEILLERLKGGEKDKKQVKAALKREKYLKHYDDLKQKKYHLTQKIQEREKFSEISKKFTKLKNEWEKYPPFDLTMDLLKKWQKYKNSTKIPDTEKTRRVDENMNPYSIDKLNLFLEKYTQNLKILEYYGIEKKDVENLKKEILEYKSLKKRYDQTYPKRQELEILRDEFSCLLKLKPKIEKSFNKITGECYTLGVFTKIYQKYEKLAEGKTHSCPSCKADIFIGLDGNISNVEEKKDYGKVFKNLKKIGDFYTLYTQKREKILLLEELLVDTNDFETKDYKDLEKIFEYTFVPDWVNQEQVEKAITYLLWEEGQKCFCEKFNHPFPEFKNIDEYFQNYLETKNAYNHQRNFLEKYEIIDENEYIQKKSLLEKIEAEIENLDKIKEILEWKKEYSKIESRRLNIAENNNKILKAGYLSEKIEFYIMQNMELFLGDFNNLINQILGDLFDDMTINLSLFKTVKSTRQTKPQVNIDIFYKGKEYESFNILSGGEKDRLSLAFTIVFSKLSKGKFMFLDECFSSLDAEWREKSVRLIKNHLREKIVVNVCHDSVEGFYDKTIRLV